jgi:hypothetical protein
MARQRRDASKLALTLDDLSNTVDASPIIESINEVVDDLVEIESKGLLAQGASVNDARTFKSFELLSSAEKLFYQKRMQQYLRDFELNKSSDMGIIHRIIMEEVHSERIYVQMLNNPAKDFSEALTQCSVRYNKALESLGANRDKRLKNRETHTFSIADLALQYASGGKEEFEEKEEKWAAEELALRGKKDEYFSEEVSHMVNEEELDEPGN